MATPVAGGHCLAWIRHLSGDLLIEGPQDQLDLRGDLGGQRPVDLMHKHDGVALHVGVRDVGALAVCREQSPEGDRLVIRQGINAIPRDESEVSHDRTITPGWCRRAAPTGRP